MQTQIITFSRIGYSLAELEIHGGLSRSTLHRTVARGELETLKRVRRRLSPPSKLKGFAEWLMPITPRRRRELAHRVELCELRSYFGRTR
jgi:transposase